MKKEQIRLILDGVSLPENIYEEYDVEGLDDALCAIDKDGALFKLDGSEYGPETVTYYIHCDHAASLWPTIKMTVEAYPLCRGARVEFHDATGSIYEEFKIRDA